MKIVDEKGRIFGKLNIIDLLVILLLVLAVALVGYKLLGPNTAAGPGTQLTYSVVVRAVEPTAYEGALQYVEQEGGDQLMANGEPVNGWVTDVKSEPHVGSASMKTDANGQRVQMMLDENTVDLTFTIKANVTNAITNEVGTQEVRIGKNHIVKTVHFEFSNGIITDCRWETPAV